MEYITLIVLLTLAFVLITHSQFKVDTFYSYDAYFFNGISHIILNSGNIVYGTIEPPYVALPSIVPTGYVPMPSISQTILSILTSADLFISAKIYTIVIFVNLILAMFILTKKITHSPTASIFSSFVFMFMPIVFYRLNYINSEPTALFFWLIMLFILLGQKKDIINSAIVPFLVAGLAFHPRSLIFYLPLMITLYFVKNGFVKNHINKKNLMVVSSMFFASIPFLKFLIDNLLAYLLRGATYTLYPPLAVQPITFQLISSQLGFFILMISMLATIYLFYDLKKIEYRFLIIWLFLSCTLIFIGSYLSFPSNRLTLHLGVVLAISCGCIIHLLKTYFMGKGFNRMVVAFLLLLIIVPIVPTFYESSYHNPFLGWGDEEKEAMLFLSNSIVKNESENDYLIFTPVYGLPFGYGIQNVEINETLIAEILLSSSEIEFLSKIYQKHPNKNLIYIIKEKNMNPIFIKRYPVLNKLDNNKIIYENKKIQIYRYLVEEIQ